MSSATPERGWETPPGLVAFWCHAHEDGAVIHIPGVTARLAPPTTQRPTCTGCSSCRRSRGGSGICAGTQLTRGGDPACPGGSTASSTSMATRRRSGAGRESNASSPTYCPRNCEGSSRVLVPDPGAPIEISAGRALSPDRADRLQALCLRKLTRGAPPLSNVERQQLYRDLKALDLGREPLPSIDGARLPRGATAAV